MKFNNNSFSSISRELKNISGCPTSKETLARLTAISDALKIHRKELESFSEKNIRETGSGSLPDNVILFHALFVKKGVQPCNLKAL